MSKNSVPKNRKKQRYPINYSTKQTPPHQSSPKPSTQASPPTTAQTIHTHPHPLCNPSQKPAPARPSRRSHLTFSFAFRFLSLPPPHLHHSSPKPRSLTLSLSPLPHPLFLKNVHPPPPPPPRPAALPQRKSLASLAAQRGKKSCKGCCDKSGYGCGSVSGTFLI